MKPSSTSNSDTFSAARLKPYSWLISVIIAVAASLGLLVVYDSWLRGQGAVPSFGYSVERWSMERARLGADRNPNSIVFLGASRMQADIDLETVERLYPEGEVYQLAVPGAAPYAALEDIAKNTAFRGTVVVSLMPWWILEAGSKHDQDQEVSYYRNYWNGARWLDTKANNLIARQFVFTDENYRLHHMLETLISEGKLVAELSHVTTSERRQLRFDFKGADLEEVRGIAMEWAQWEIEQGGEPEASDWAQALADTSALVSKIRARGGQVVMCRMPTAGLLREQETALYPRERYWDDMAGNIPADAHIHFDDYDSLSDFEFPDYSHVDYRDAPAFTQALFEAIEASGVSIRRRDAPSSS